MPIPKDGADTAPRKDETQATDKTQEADTKKVVNPRDEIIARMSERIAESREGDEHTEETAEAGDEPADEAGQVVEATDEPAAGKGGGKEASKSSEDSLADFTVIKDGKPMVRLKVNGEERFMTLDAARATLQKNEAAELRLQQAAAERKALDARAAQLQAQEAEFAARAKKSQPSAKDVDDQALDAEVDALAKSLLTESETEVAARLKKVLKPRQATPAVDENAIVSKVVKAVAQEGAAREQTRELATGWTQFQTDYPDIATDPKLFAVADSMSDSISAEHPEWSPSKVMLESGKRTKEWVEGFKPTAAAPNDRQARKDKLRPMPQSRSARQESAPVEKPQTPAEKLAEIRKARGQAA